MLITTNGVIHNHDDHGAHEAALHGYARSPHFEVLEHKDRVATGAPCAISGNYGGTQWHHAWVPFHFARHFGRWELEFSKRNLIWLEQIPGNEIHRVFGHCLFFQSYNPTAVDDIARYKDWTAARIQSDPRFIAQCNNRPKSLRDMLPHELDEMHMHITKVLPPLAAELDLFRKYKPKA